jgi:hypothetical protein
MKHPIAYTSAQFVDEFVHGAVYYANRVRRGTFVRLFVYTPRPLQWMLGMQCGIPHTHYWCATSAKDMETTCIKLLAMDLPTEQQLELKLLLRYTALKGDERTQVAELLATLQQYKSREFV